MGADLMATTLERLLRLLDNLDEAKVKRLRDALAAAKEKPRQ